MDFALLPLQTGCLQHFQTFIFLPRPLQPCAIKSYPVFKTPKLLNSPPLCVCLPLKLSPWYFYPSHCLLIPSQGSSPPRLYPSITVLSSDSSTYSTCFFPNSQLLLDPQALSSSLIAYLCILPSPPTCQALILLPLSNLIPFCPLSHPLFFPSAL